MPKDIVEQAISRLGGWVEHDGSDCPIPSNTLVICRFAWESEEKATSYAAVPAYSFPWAKNKVEYGQGHVVAYRIVKHA